MIRIFPSAVDATLSPTDKKVLKIIVKSWENLPNLEKISGEVETERSGKWNGGNASNYNAYNNHSGNALLAAKKESSLWQVTIGFEAEQACSLALTHIEKRRYARYVSMQ